MSDTPRTDAVTKAWPMESFGEMRGLAMQLERENAELVEALKAVTAFVQPSMHVRNAEAMVAQDNARALLAKLGR